MKNKMQVEGDKIILRRLTANDITAEYLAWLNDEDVTRGLETVARPYTQEMLEQYIHDVLANENTYMFMVLDKTSGKTIGTAKVHNISKKNGTCNLGLMLGDKNYWGKGYGQDAYNTAIDFAFKTLGIRRIWEMANANNVASLSMCKKAGFQIEGQLKEHTLSEGKYIDKIVLGLFARDWKK
jgi:RimJ/RimL family protein N-acetyltransferase